MLQVVNENFISLMTEDKILDMLSKSSEFEQIKASNSIKSLGHYY